MPVTQTLILENDTGESAVISFTTMKMTQENKVITLMDAEGKKVATISILDSVRYRVI
jgi:hypothetical protein